LATICQKSKGAQVLENPMEGLSMTIVGQANPELQICESGVLSGARLCHIAQTYTKDLGSAEQKTKK
jgi:hypothetical protein